MNVRGILLAGRTAVGRGRSRWRSTPLTPVHDKPMVYYPLSTLMLAGVREVLVVTAPQDADGVRHLLGDGEQLGMHLRYAVQPHPDGPGQALLLGAEFVREHPVALALGDNLFYGPGLGARLSRYRRPAGAHIFATRVMNPRAYGVVEFDALGAVMSIEEKPARPRSDFAVPGLYLYPPDVGPIAAELADRTTGPLEITAVNRAYHRLGRLTATPLDRSISWLDIGTVDALGAADEFVRLVEARDGNKIGCVEEIAWRQGWLDDEGLLDVASRSSLGYGRYLRQLVRHRRADAAVVVLPRRDPRTVGQG